MPVGSGSALPRCLIFILLLFARFIVDWVQMFARQWTPHGPVLVVLEAVYSITDPPIKAVRRILPPLRLGGMALDLSSDGRADHLLPPAVRRERDFPPLIVRRALVLPLANQR